MKLTSELLTGVYEETEELRRLDIVTENHEVFADLEALAQQIQGAMSMLEDLYVAKDSLKAVGYSTEWMDCINQDNNFMMVVKPDLQNFFGGDEAKTASCESAIIDTIKRWAVQVWEWIKQVFAKLIRAMKAFLQIWAHRQVDTKQAVTQLERCVNIAASGKTDLFKKCFEGIEWRDPVVLHNYIESYAYLHTVMLVNTLDALGFKVNRNADGSVAQSSFRTPLPPDQAMSTKTKMLADYEGVNKDFSAYIVSRWSRTAQTDTRASKRFKNMPTLKENGFAFIAGGKVAAGTECVGGMIIADVFTDTDSVPRTPVNTSNPLTGKMDIAEYIKQAATTISFARLTAKYMTDCGVDADENFRNRKQEYDRLLSHPGIDPDDPVLKFYQMQLVFLKEFTHVFAKLESRCVAIANGLERNVRIIQTNLSQFEKSVSGEFNS